MFTLHATKHLQCCSTVDCLLELLCAIIHMVKKFPKFMEPKGSDNIKKSVKGPILGQINSVNTFTHYLSKTEFNIILPFVTMSSCGLLRLFPFLYHPPPPNFTYHLTP